MAASDGGTGTGLPVQIIAEIGGNHDGSLSQAYLLIDAAANAGADACKFQFFNPDTLYPGTFTTGSIREDWLESLKGYCTERGVDFGCSVFDRETLELYLATDPLWVKIASPEATNRELLKAAADSGVPVLVSTGAMDRVMVAATVAALAGSVFTLLHCVSAYPSAPDEMNLAAMASVGRRYQVPVGLSDHTRNPSMAPIIATALGATVIEKHLTLNRELPGADHGFALEPDEFKSMVADVRMAERMLGDGVKRVQPSEDVTDRRVA